MTAGTRSEADAFGSVAIPADRYWGAQTQRALGVFRIGGERLPVAVVRAFGLQKGAAARANRRLGRLPEGLADAIAGAAAELAAGAFDEHFPLPVWQTGSGTQTNMNANEVIANRANERLGAGLGTRAPVHPNDHVNLGQSSNDSFPTVMNLAAVLACERRLAPALRRLHGSLDGCARRFAGAVRIGRTHLNDAVPMTMGQAFAGYARQVELGLERVEGSLPRLRLLAQGGTAVGTGLNAAPGFDAAFCEELSALAGTPFAPNPVKVEGMAAHDALVELSGVLNVLATSLTKIANDVRLLGSGPRCGLGELVVPDDGLTSSIMPGKRNATLAEALVQVCQRVTGNHVTATLAGASGLFELNVAKPALVHAVLQSAELLADAGAAFATGLVDGLAVDEARLARNVAMALMPATALTPRLGYDAVAAITRRAERDGLSVRDATLALGLMSAAEFDAAVDPAALARPHD
ncbi:class II fumarate hydratase [Azospirillum sp. ST 5-10]|uniref:class II fumarate hydratase n=1 Tax=unclassified Azospirillum TaxID=2630922 RepID=UPI003F4A4096